METFSEEAIKWFLVNYNCFEIFSGNCLKCYFGKKNRDFVTIAIILNHVYMICVYVHRTRMPYALN